MNSLIYAVAGVVIVFTFILVFSVIKRQALAKNLPLSKCTILFVVLNFLILSVLLFIITQVMAHFSPDQAVRETIFILFVIGVPVSALVTILEAPFALIIFRNARKHIEST